MTLSPDMIAACLGLGLFVGGIGSFFGIGGGFIVTPFLHILMGFSAPVAVATSTGQIVLMSASGSWHYLREKKVQLRLTGLLLAGSLPAAWITAWLIGKVDSHPMGRTIVWQGMTAADIGLFVSFTLGIGGLGLFNLYKSRRMKNIRSHHEPSADPAPVIRMGETWLFGLFTGVVSVTLGIGGGFITFPFLAYRCKMAPAQAVGTGMAVMWCTTMLASMRYGLSGTLAWQPALLIGGAGAVGAQLGSRLAITLRPIILVRALGWMQLAVALLYGIGELVKIL